MWPSNNVEACGAVGELEPDWESAKQRFDDDFSMLPIMVADCSDQVSEAEDNVEAH